jgi:hypothetical protein
MDLGGLQRDARDAPITHLFCWPPHVGETTLKSKTPVFATFRDAVTITKKEKFAGFFGGRRTMNQMLSREISGRGSLQVAPIPIAVGCRWFELLAVVPRAFNPGLSLLLASTRWLPQSRA